MKSFAVEDLYDCMDRAFGLVGFDYAPSMTSQDVPGWDSLHHTLLMVEIERQTGADLSPEGSATLPDIQALYTEVLKRIPA